MQLVGGQPTAFPANETQIYLVECKVGFMWPDGNITKIITCINETWTKLPQICKRITYELMIFNFALLLIE